MTLPGFMRHIVIFTVVIATMPVLTWAQQSEVPPLSLGARIIFGYGLYQQGTYTNSGPSATLDANLDGYWRDPRILQFSVQPMVTMGSIVPGTEMGNPLTGFSGVGIFMQGSSFPLTVSYSRNSSSLEESGYQGSQHPGLLSGISLGTTNTVFNVNWMLRFKHLPIVTFDYRDTGYSSDLPKEFATGIDRNLKHFGAHLQYSVAGFHIGAWDQRTKSDVTNPDVLEGGVESDHNNTNEYGFNVSRRLPLDSMLGLSGDQSDSTFTFDGQKTDITVKNANAFLSSQPFSRLTTFLQAQYTSNLQGYQLEQALAGTGVPVGTTSPGSASPLVYLAAPFSTTTFGGGVGYRFGHGITLSGSAGEGHSSHQGNMIRWSFGPSYQHSWRSGSIATGYFYNSFDTQTEIVNYLNQSSYTFFYQTVDTNTGTVSLNQGLPDNFKLTANTHVSIGTLKDNGIPYPNHDYGGLASVEHPVGQWLLTGSVNVEKNDADHELIHNESTAKAFSLTAAYHGLNISATRSYGNGLALQLGDSLVFVNNPTVITPVIGAPVLSSTTGTSLVGSYRTRNGRLVIMGNFGHFNYQTASLTTNQNTFVNLRVAYKLRRLRLVTGFIDNTQELGTNSLGNFNTRVFYFQVERVLRFF